MRAQSSSLISFCEWEEVNYDPDSGQQHAFSSRGQDKALNPTLSVSEAKKRERSFFSPQKKPEANLSPTEGLSRGIDLKHYSREDDEKRNTVFSHHWSILAICR